MPSTRRYELSDAQWARLEPLLPPEKPWTGRPNDAHRRILNGILWILNSVARPAAALWSGGHGVEPVLPLAGVWQHVLEALQAEGRVGWELHFLDSTVVPACRRGAQNRPRVRHRGRGAGPIAWRLHDPLALRGLRQACYLHGDRGSRHPAGERPDQPRRDPAHRPGAPAAYQAGRRQGLQQPQHPACPAEARHHPGDPDQERRQPGFDREAYRQRNIVERLINRLKNFRRIATRYEKRAANYLAMITIGAILLWL